MSEPDGLMETAPCGFVSFADDGTVLSVNAGLLDMLGYERADVVGRHVERLMGVGSRIFYQTHLFPLIRMHGRAEEIYLALRTRTGDDAGVLLNAVRREREGAGVTDCVLMRVRQRERFEGELLRARKEAQRLRAAAEAASRAKSQFLAVMSHELRTPLNAIAGYVQLLKMGVHGPVTEQQVEALDRIDRSQRRQLRMINDVLNLSRLESGRVEYELSTVALRAALDEVLPMVEPQVVEKGLALEVQVSSEAEVTADAAKLEQILLNLLSNAIKFTAKGGRIRVGASLTGSTAALAVVDTGIGIPSEKLSGIFDPFVQVDATGRSEGTGLGLSISRDLARGMGGDLEVESVVGQGSTFTLTLPRAAKVRSPRPAPPPA